MPEIQLNYRYVYQRRYLGGPPVMCILRGYLEKTLQIRMAQDGSDGGEPPGHN